jgi:hypothetical protein
MPAHAPKKKKRIRVFNMQCGCQLPEQEGEIQRAALISLGLCNQPRIFVLLFIRPSGKRETGEMEGMHHGSEESCSMSGIVFTPYTYCKGLKQKTKRI